jgi:hypothetical protein
MQISCLPQFGSMKCLGTPKNADPPRLALSDQLPESLQRRVQGDTITAYLAMTF